MSYELRITLWNLRSDHRYSNRFTEILSNWLDQGRRPTDGEMVLLLSEILAYGTQHMITALLDEADPRRKAF